MGKMKLTYFNLRARAEIARLILAQAGEDYEDKRIEFSDWPALKPCKINNSNHQIQSIFNIYYVT